MKNKRKKTVVILSMVALLLVGVFISADIYAKSATSKITFDIVDATGVADGVYVGEYAISPVVVSVEVTVQEEEITNIVILEHQAGLGGKAETIVNEILENQSLEVDAVSGATVNSTTIREAIENAFEQWRPQT